MCGIIGYVGRSQATSILLESLKRLEYRGYDSAGIAVETPWGVRIQRVEGKIARLDALVRKEPIEGTTGIGHTRWATHGRPTETNAHPHRSGNITLVHNGIIENYRELKSFLITRGFSFVSETDTEVVCHLIEYFCREGESTFSAIGRACSQLEGSYAFVIMNEQEPNVLYAAKNRSPLVIGEGEGACFVASDIPALLPYTKEVTFLEDGERAVLDAEGVKLFDAEGCQVVRPSQHIPWNPLMAERGGYKHFMLKEIFEQPNVLQDVLAGRIDKEQGRIVLDEIEGFFQEGKPRFDRILLIACGTSYHAGLVARYLVESLTRMPVAVDLASEFRYRDPLIDERTLIIPISQSGETADTLAAESLARERGASILAVCNVVGSSIARAADATLYTHAGPEIGVASTKAFTAQIAVLYLFALALAERLQTLSSSALATCVSELLQMPRLFQETLESAPQIKEIAQSLVDAPHVLYVGRGANYPIALEGALKFKEISYIHAEGFAAGELKHGPIALIDHGIPVVALAHRDQLHGKVISNIEEVKARGARVVAIVTAGDEGVQGMCEHQIPIPAASWYVTPMLASLPLQLLAYYAADHKGTDVDQPRNLAKSVTVE